MKWLGLAVMMVACSSSVDDGQATTRVGGAGGAIGGSSGTSSGGAGGATGGSSGTSSGGAGGAIGGSSGASSGGVGGASCEGMICYQGHASFGYIGSTCAGARFARPCTPLSPGGIDCVNQGERCPGEDAGAAVADGAVVQSDAHTCSFRLDQTVCGTCTQTLAEYCRGTCPTLHEWRCDRYTGVVQTTLRHGCGYLEASYSGDVGDHWGEVYVEATGALVYAWNNGKRSAGCSDAMTAGTLPTCATWSAVTCADLASDGGRGDSGDGSDAASDAP